MTPTTVPLSHAGATDIVEYVPGEDHLPPETDDEAEALGPDENWMFWDRQIRTALRAESRFRAEGAEAERLIFGPEPKSDSSTTRKLDKIGDDVSLIHSTIEVLKPMHYSEIPTPIVERRFRGDGKPLDQTDLMASEVAQRLAQYLIDTEPLDDAMKAARDDWLGPGRGAIRVIYSADFEPDTTLPDGTVQPGRKISERVTPRAPEWRRLLLGTASAWHALPWLAFETPMTRHEVKKRFDPLTEPGKPPISSRMAFNHPGLTDNDLNTENERDQGGLDGRPDRPSETMAGNPSPFDTATVWEIWNRQTREVIWWSPHFNEGILDKESDPLRLADFWPCAKPLVATVRGQGMNPRPDVRYYQHRAEQAERAAKKMDSILKTLSISAFIPGSMSDDIKKILSGENQIVAIANWTSLLEKGGTANLVQWLPIEAMIRAAAALQEMREAAKAAMFEASGVSDIMRSQGDPNETATAQQMKGRFSNLRLRDRQQACAFLARDTIRIMVEVAVTFFDLQLIADITALDLPVTEAERAQIVAQYEQAMMQHQVQVRMVEMMAEQAAMQAQQAGQEPPPPPPMPPAPDLPEPPQTSYELVMARLRDDLTRKIVVTIETDSTVLDDDQQDRQARTEFLSAFATLLQELWPAVAAGQMDMKLFKELMLFGVRGFPKARTLEHLIDDLPDTPKQQGQAEDTAITVAKIKAETDKLIKQMDMQDSQLDRVHEVTLKNVDLATERARGGNPSDPKE